MKHLSRCATCGVRSPKLCISLNYMPAHIVLSAPMQVRGSGFSRWVAVQHALLCPLAITSGFLTANDKRAIVKARLHSAHKHGSCSICC